MAKKQTDQALPDVQEILPHAGGSYTRHPETGELTRVEWTKQRDEAEADAGAVHESQPLSITTQE